MQIHHNTIHRANKWGITFIDLGNTVQAKKGTRVLAEGINPRLVLDDAIAELNHILLSKEKPKKGILITKATSIATKSSNAAGNGKKAKDGLSKFIFDNFTTNDGSFMWKEFIKFVKENNIDPGQYADAANPNIKHPNGFIGRARMTLRNMLAGAARRNTNQLIFNNKPYKINV